MPALAWNKDSWKEEKEEDVKEKRESRYEKKKKKTYPAAEFSHPLRNVFLPEEMYVTENKIEKRRRTEKVRLW